MEDREQLKKLHTERDALFVKLRNLVCAQHGYDPRTLSDTQSKEIDGKANELVDKWELAPFDDRRWKPKTDLDQLLAEIEENGVMILEILDDEEERKARKHGLIKDDDK